MAMFLASEKVWILSAAMPVEVGTGATPQLTLPLYTGIAHGPTTDMAAFFSAKESPVYASCGASLSAYIVRQKLATFLPASESKVALPSSTSCVPSLSAAYSG